MLSPAKLQIKANDVDKLNNGSANESLWRKFH